MSRLDENKPFHQMDDKERLNEAKQFGGVLIEKHVDEGEYHPDQMNAMSWLIERVEELEKENRSLNREIGKWSNHVWAIAEESFVVGSKAKQLLNEMIKGESE